MKGALYANPYAAFFSHVYVEREAYGYPLTQRVLGKLSRAEIVPIGHYKDIFNRPGQVYAAQKNSQKLILAVRKNHFAYPGAKINSPCDSCSHPASKSAKPVFYATQMLNCPYDCAYCYLRGMHGSANIAAFVNTYDYFSAVRPLSPAYICLSYETDLLAMEPLFGFVSEWLAYAADNPGLTFEIRTKSANFIMLPAALRENALPNVIFAWTVTGSAYEKKAPSVQARLGALREAIQNGWKVMLCIDPVIAVDGWEEALTDLLAQVKGLPLYDIRAGGFRMSAEQFKKIKRNSPVAAALPLTVQDGIMRYPPEIEKEIKRIFKIYID
jgi:spore photoproduct lyase